MIDPRNSLPRGLVRVVETQKAALYPCSCRIVYCHAFFGVVPVIASIERRLKSGQLRTLRQDSCAQFAGSAKPFRNHDSRLPQGQSSHRETRNRTDLGPPRRQFRARLVRQNGGVLDDRRPCKLSQHSSEWLRWTHKESRLTASTQLLARQPAELATVILHVAALFRSYGCHAADVRLVGLRSDIARIVAVRPRAVICCAIACASQIA